MAKNYYVILGISSGASDDDIKAAYRRLAKAYHPDHYSGNLRTFLDVQEAYSVLSDAHKRRDYDRRVGASIRPAYPSGGKYVATGPNTVWHARTVRSRAAPMALTPGCA